MTCENCLHYAVCTALETNGISKIPPSQCGCFENRENWQEIHSAYWKRQPSKDPEAVCSHCGREVVYQIIDGKWAFENFCPHCGAEMEIRGGLMNGGKENE